MAGPAVERLDLLDFEVTPSVVLRRGSRVGLDVVEGPAWECGVSIVAKAPEEGKWTREVEGTVVAAAMVLW